MNNVTLIGRLTRDIEVRYLPQTQTAVMQNTLAVRGKKKDTTEFITISAFGKLAEMMGQYLRKGSLIGINGHIHTGSYESQRGRVYTTEVVIDGLDFLEKKEKQEETFEEHKQEETFEEFEMTQEELPF